MKIVPIMTVKKIVLLSAVFLGALNCAFADRGAGKKSKNKTAFNIAVPTTLRNSIAYNLRTGLNYRGSFVTGNNTRTANTSIAAFQKGNIVYIIPYKHRVAVPEVRPGYAGVKLILKPRK